MSEGGKIVQINTYDHYQIITPQNVTAKKDALDFVSMWKEVQNTVNFAVAELYVIIGDT